MVQLNLVGTFTLKGTYLHSPVQLYNLVDDTLPIAKRHKIWIQKHLIIEFLLRKIVSQPMHLIHQMWHESDVA